MSQISQSMSQALVKAAASVTAREPFAVVFARALTESDLPPALQPQSLLDFWHSRSPGSAVGGMRYRWDITHEHIASPDYAGRSADWKAWRAREQPVLERGAERFEQRLCLPILIAESCELLAELAVGGSHPLAADLLEESESLFRKDCAHYASASHAWSDTFALFNLVRRPRTLQRLHPFAIAIAGSYAAVARHTDGLVPGTRFPFHQVPMVSTTAQLAAGLIALGQDLPLAARLVEHVLAAQRDNGGWGDEEGATDVLTSFVSADLLAHVVPGFDPADSAGFFADNLGQDGLWRALGPEAPWLSWELDGWRERARLPFAERFRWPHLPVGHRDHKTGLPFYAYFSNLAEFFVALPGLAEADTELCFLDLIGFRAFNNQFGQQLGDEVLAAFAAGLDEVSAARAIRDGGDEFLLVGAPSGVGLGERLRTKLESWPNKFRSLFGDTAPPVTARVLIATTKGAKLRAARQLLGRAVGDLKDAAADWEGGVWRELGHLE